MDVINKNWILWVVTIIAIIVLSAPFWLLNVLKGTPTSIVVLGDNTNVAKSFNWLIEYEKIDNKNKQLILNDADYDSLVENDYDFVYVTTSNSRLTNAQMTNLKNHMLYNGGNIVMEHSLFDLTTSSGALYDLETLSNVRWTGWKGLTYTEETRVDIPNWIYELYEKRYNRVWVPPSEGVIFVNSFNDDIVVLADDDFSNHRESMLQVKGNALQYGTLNLDDYLSWFTIVEPVNMDEVLTNYELLVSDVGIDKLNKHSIPLSFPAIIEHRTKTYNMTLFLGEFSKLDMNSEEYNSNFQKIFGKEILRSNEADPFWNLFYPVTSTLFKNQFQPSQTEATTSYIDEGEYQYKTRGREGEQFIEIYKEGSWQTFNVKGVNLGMGKPGFFPGEVAITESEYFRWFKQIGDMNANAIRIYTLQSPSFYKALYEYNLIAEHPLYFFQGAWVIEEYVIEYENMFVDAIEDSFYNEISYVIDAVYGNTEIEKQAGHAYGSYEFDVSDFLIGWIIGIEFSGETVLSTNEKNIEMAQYEGQNIMTTNASPFEIWLAKSMDYTVNYEIEQYRRAHPISYTNWPTTDLLEHPYELEAGADLDEINPNHIEAKVNFAPGQFYSFHIYPYYPDFIDEGYGHYTDKFGKKNAYAGYLNDLKKNLNFPSIVAEFGIPSSRGITHYGQLGRNQGGHREDMQGKHIVELYKDLLSEGYGGGLIFAWQDEWFKRTWNTMDLDNEDRRPYWSNYQTNEQYFGLLSFESGKYETAIHLDGQINDWDIIHNQPLYQIDNPNGLHLVLLHYDARYLYLRLDYNKLHMNNLNTTIYFDTVPNQGNKSVLDSNYEYQDGFEFALRLINSNEVELVVDSYYDVYQYQNGYIFGSIDHLQSMHQKNNGMYHPIRLLLSRAYSKIGLDGQEIKRPYDDIDTGKFQYGNSNPNSDNYNSLADYYINEQDGIIELRIPWLLLNFRDPSQKEVISDLYRAEGRGIQGEFIEGIRLLAVQNTHNKLVTLPIINSSNRTIHINQLNIFSWENWDYPLYHERLKTSYYDIQQLFKQY